VPASPRFLAELAAAFDDPRVAGATSRVLPRPEDDPLAARTVLDLPEASTTPWTRDLDASGPIWTLPAAERARLVRFNNVASAIRTAVFQKIPFPDVPFAEDFAWAARALTAGWRLAHAPESVAYHAHAYDLAGAFERYRVDATFHRLAHGWRLRPSLLSVARGVLFEVRADAAYLFGQRAPGRLRHILRSPALRAAQVLGQYAGSRA
jgi:GT2 family glycosyltransferase